MYRYIQISTWKNIYSERKCFKTPNYNALFIFSQPMIMKSKVLGESLKLLYGDIFLNNIYHLIRKRFLNFKLQKNIKKKIKIIHNKSTKDSHSLCFGTDYTVDSCLIIYHMSSVFFCDLDVS